MKKLWPIYLYIFFQCYCLEYKGIDVVHSKALAYASFVLMWVYSFMLRKYNKKNSADRRITSVLNLITIAITLSIVPAYLIEGQSLGTSIMTTMAFIFVMMNYNIFKRLKIDPQRLERILVAFGFIYVGIVIVNILTFPNMLFGSGELDLERGGIRMRSNMLVFGVFSFFYFINEYLIQRKKVYLLYAFVMFIAVASSLFRIFIILMLGLGAILILRYTSLKKKVWILLTLGLIFFLVIPQTSIYKNLVEVSEAQKEVSDNSKEDVRLRGNRYFFIESQTGIGSVLFGHGIASLGHSEYGKKEEARQGETGIYQADAGWGGIFHDYGIIASLGFVYLLLYGVFKKKGRAGKYLSYYYAFVFLVAFAHGVLQNPIMPFLLVTSFYVMNYKQQMCGTNKRMKQL